jgi:hypothetical protein
LLAQALSKNVVHTNTIPHRSLCQGDLSTKRDGNKAEVSEAIGIVAGSVSGLALLCGSAGRFGGGVDALAVLSYRAERLMRRGAATQLRARGSGRQGLCPDGSCGRFCTIAKSI